MCGPFLAASATLPVVGSLRLDGLIGPWLMSIPVLAVGGPLVGSLVAFGSYGRGGRVRWTLAGAAIALGMNLGLLIIGVVVVVRAAPSC